MHTNKPLLPKNEALAYFFPIVPAGLYKKNNPS